MSAPAEGLEAVVYAAVKSSAAAHSLTAEERQRLAREAVEAVRRSSARMSGWLVEGGDVHRLSAVKSVSLGTWRVSSAQEGAFDE